MKTAICEEYNKPDDCYELTALRGFRDNWLKQQPDGHEIIAHYYATAPGIVKRIDKQENRTEIYHYLNETYLSKCLSYIKNQENEKCKDIYLSMIEYLQKEQMKWQ